MAYYKIVRTNPSGDYLSFAVPKSCAEFCIKYSVGEFSYPADGSKLFAFDSEESLREYMSHVPFVNNFKYFECEVINPEPYNKNIIAVFLANRLILQTYWAFGGKDDDGFAPPHGTIICDAIKLIKEIKL